MWLTLTVNKLALHHLNLLTWNKVKKCPYPPLGSRTKRSPHMQAMANHTFGNENTDTAALFLPQSSGYVRNFTPQSPEGGWQELQAAGVHSITPIICLEWTTVVSSPSGGLGVWPQGRAREKVTTSR